MSLFEYPHKAALTARANTAIVLRALGDRDVIVLLRLVALQNVWPQNPLEIVVRRIWDDELPGPHAVAPEPSYKDALYSMSHAGIVWSLPVAHGEQVELVAPDIGETSPAIEVDYVLEVIT